MENNGIIVIIRTIILCVAAVACVFILKGAVIGYRTAGVGDGLNATGSASLDFDADLIVWGGNFSAYAYTTSEAYEYIKAQADSVKKYLEANGVSQEEYVFGAVDISTHYTDRYDADGNYQGCDADGFDLYQRVTVTSKDVDKVEKISRDISQLIESGVDFMSSSPEYYCTTLDEVKLELIEKATANAKQRIEIMANANSCKVGDMMSSNLGVFQITAQNAGTDSYSYDGAFDTSSRHKTATITVRLKYDVK